MKNMKEEEGAVMENDVRCLLFGGVVFLTGLVVGLSSGFLMAPQSGNRTRRHLRTMMEDVGERAGEFMEDAREKMEDVVERGKKLVV